MDQAQKLRALANWYREFAERAGNSAIWDARLRTAEKLEEEANSLEHRGDPASSATRGERDQRRNGGCNG
jgi:hypothetical protein